MSKSESGKNIEKIFNEASEPGPTILVIDELDGSASTVSSITSALQH